MRNVSDKNLDKMKRHILYSVVFSPENHGVYEITWKNMVEPDRPQMTVYCVEENILFAWWLTKATNTHC
jgi:hypothetical protein